MPVSQRSGAVIPSRQVIAAQDDGPHWRIARDRSCDGENQTDLELMLRNRGIDTLFVCGVTTEVCVNTTVREANDRGFRCVVLSDCCASYFPQFHEAGLAMIKAQGGIFGSVAASYRPLCRKGRRR